MFKNAATPSLLIRKLTTISCSNEFTVISMAVRQTNICKILATCLFFFLLSITLCTGLVPYLILRMEKLAHYCASIQSLDQTITMHLT
jgi:hypothetical protein